MRGTRFLNTLGFGFLMIFQLAALPPNPQPERRPSNSNDTSVQTASYMGAPCQLIENVYEVTFPEKNARGKLICKRYRVAEFIKRCAGEDFPVKIIEKTDNVPAFHCD